MPDREFIGRTLAGSGGATGAVYEAERVVGGAHAALMRYDLNRSD